MNSTKSTIPGGGDCRTVAPLSHRPLRIVREMRLAVRQHRVRLKMTRLWQAFVGLILVARIGSWQGILDLFPDHPGSLICWTETRSTPRALRIHYLKVALDAQGLEVLALPGEDPDGSGPAESQLTMPADLFRTFNALAAVNANAFDGFQNPGKADPGWYEGRPVDIRGMVVATGKWISLGENNRTSFWLDSLGKPHIGNPAPGSFVMQAVSDWFSPLLIDSRIIPDPADHVLHPRTALGFDDSGTWLLLVVVDGRQPGFSEGVSLHELAGILQSQGCSQSVNLDGGGSSIMLIRGSGNEVRTVNSPSGKSPRPVPVMLGIRKTPLTPSPNPVP
jgi:hypothetical protein